MASVNKPIFGLGKVVNVRMSKKVRADLKEIIEVSGRIKEEWREAESRCPESQ